jgi:nitroreductase
MENVFATAQRSPSSFNLQPWRVLLVEGETLKLLKETLTDAFRNGKPLDLPPTPDNFKYHAENQGAVLYREGFGIPREDKEARFNATMNNFENYGAPTVAILSMDGSLSMEDILSCGMYLENLILLLHEQGLRTIPQISLVGYGDLVRKVLNIPEDQMLLCALAIGYADEKARVNKIKQPRDPWENNVRFLG